MTAAHRYDVYDLATGEFDCSFGSIEAVEIDLGEFTQDELEELPVGCSIDVHFEGDPAVRIFKNDAAIEPAARIEIEADEDPS